MRKIMDITKKLFVVAGLAYAAMMVSGCGGSGGNLFTDTLKSVSSKTTVTSQPMNGTPGLLGDPKGGVDLPSGATKIKNTTLCPDGCRLVANVGQSMFADKVPDKIKIGSFELPVTNTMRSSIKDSLDAPPSVNYNQKSGLNATFPLVSLNPNAEKTGASFGINAGLNQKGPYGTVQAGYNLPGKLPSIMGQFSVGNAGPGSSIGLGGKIGTFGNTPIGVYVPLIGGGGG